MTSGLGGLFGRGSIAEQIFVWGVLNNIINAVGSPFFTLATYNVNERFPVVEHTPADLALMVVRNVLGAGQAAAEAKRAGINPERFGQLVDITGDAPAPGDLAVALRRKLIDRAGTGPGSTSFDQGIREGRLKDKWIEVMRQLATEWPTPTDILEALLQGQIGHADAVAKYEQTGGDPAWFELLFHTRGAGPTPVEAGTLANRGIIPWDGTGPDTTSFEQAFLESRFRNKWLHAYRRLAEYRPPPRTIVAMLRAGSLTRAQATTLLRQFGLTDELAAAYVADATHAKASAGKELTESQIVGLFETGALTHAEAVAMLVKFGLSAHDADLIVAGAGARRELAQVNSAITKIRTSFLARHITAPAATKALGSVGVTAQPAEAMVRIWSAELGATPRVLTDAQITRAVKLGILGEAEGRRRLEADGWRARDAWILLSLAEGGKLPGEPPA